MATTHNLITRIRKFVDKYVVLPQEEAQGTTLALWVIHTWMFGGEQPTPYTTPYLYVHSPEKRSGKTRLMEVLGELARNPVNTASISPSAMFRLIEAMRPTLMVDEVDAIWSGAKNEELRGIVNSGYKHSGHVWRTDGLEATKFSTFGPKLFSGIDNGQLPDTVRDRCIPIKMRRRKDDDPQVHDFYSYEISDEVKELVDEIAEWVAKNGVRVHEMRPKPIDGIGDRAWEIAMPLVSIAKVMGMETQAKKALSTLLSDQGDDVLSPGQQLLSDIRDLFTEADEDRLSTNHIIEHLDAGWTGKLLSERLKAFDVRPGPMRIQNVVTKGYYLKSFADAWARYLD